MDEIILWNPRQILNKEIELKFLVYKENPDIIALCETWLKGKDKLKIQNVDTIRKDRENQLGGGLAFLIKNNIV